MPAHRRTKAKRSQAGQPMRLTRSKNAPATGHRECTPAAISLPVLLPILSADANLEAAQTTDATPSSRGSSPPIDIPQRWLRIVNLKDVGVTSADYFFALKDPADYVPKTWTGERKKSTQSKSQKPTGPKIPNGFIICRALNGKNVLAAKEQVDGVSAKTKKYGTEGTGNCSSVMRQVWWYMTKGERGLYCAHSKYLKLVHKEYIVPQSNEEEQVIASSGDISSGNGASSSRKALCPKRTSKNSQRPRNSKRPPAGVQADCLDNTSRDTFAHHASSLPSSVAAEVPSTQAINIAPHVFSQGHNPQLVATHGVFASLHAQTHRRHNFGPVDHTRNLRYTGHPYLSLPAGTSSTSALDSRQQSYTTSQVSTIDLASTPTSTIPQISGPRRPFQDITNVNPPSNLTTTTMAWADNIHQEGAVPYTISDYSAPSNVTDPSLATYSAFRIGDYIPIDSQLPSLYNVSMQSEAGVNAQPRTYGHTL